MNSQIEEGLSIKAGNSLKLMGIMGFKITISFEDPIYKVRCQDPDLGYDFTETGLTKESAFWYAYLRIGMNIGMWF